LPGPLAAADTDKARLRPLADIEPERYPWGSIRWLMNGKIDPNAEMTMGLVRIEPHQSNQRHVHPNSAEYLHVLSGSCKHLVDGRWITIKPGDTRRIPTGVEHQARTKDAAFQAFIVYDTPNRIMVPVAEERPRAKPE
jgi:quercetin dioxygenase-like cupin family protein